MNHLFAVTSDTKAPASAWALGLLIACACSSRASSGDTKGEATTSSEAGTSTASGSDASGSEPNPSTSETTANTDDSSTDGSSADATNTSEATGEDDGSSEGAVTSDDDGGDCNDSTCAQGSVAADEPVEEGYSANDVAALYDGLEAPFSWEIDTLWPTNLFVTMTPIGEATNYYGPECVWGNFLAIQCSGGLSFPAQVGLSTADGMISVEGEAEVFFHAELGSALSTRSLLMQVPAAEFGGELTSPVVIGGESVELGDYEFYMESDDWDSNTTSIYAINDGTMLGVAGFPNLDP